MEQSQRVDEALQMWNHIAGLTLSGEPVADAPHIPVYFKRAAPFVRGFYDDDAGVVIVNRALTAHAHSVTIAHELGHAFGLHHVARSSRHSVMNPGTPDIAPTAQDAQVLLAHWPNCAGPSDAPSDAPSDTTRPDGPTPNP